MVTFENEQAMSLAARLRKLREDKGMSVEELAAKAKISKTYLWELERDTSGAKKPSADALLKIARALSTTLADVLSLELVMTPEGPKELPPSLSEFRKRMELQKTPVPEEELSDLVRMKFRGGQPQTADGWQQLYLLLSNSVRGRKA